jgi:hypothetical protein
VISVGVAKAQHQPPRDIAAEGVDQLLLHEAHRGSAQDDDTLIVQADDAEVRPEVEQLGQLKAIDVR